jgi:predicted nucleic acid-binding protein
MIHYFDTSAFVALLIDEAGTSRARHLWRDAERLASSRLLYVEASAALAQAWRLGRLDQDQLAGALVELERLDSQVGVVRVGDSSARRAAAIAVDLGLRGYDAVHCASAEQLLPDGVVMVSGDAKLLDASAKLGMATADTNAP